MELPAALWRRVHLRAAEEVVSKKQIITTALEAREMTFQDYLIGDRPVRCSRHDTDRYGRIIGDFVAGGVGLNARMVSLGMAMAWRRGARLPAN